MQKVSPDVARIAVEATCLAARATEHTPKVLAVDDGVGALLLEAIEPDFARGLGRSLHVASVPWPTYPTLAERVDYLFDFSTRLFDRSPELAGVVSPGLYERGRRLASRLVQDAAPVGGRNNGPWRSASRRGVCLPGARRSPA